MHCNPIGLYRTIPQLLKPLLALLISMLSRVNSPTLFADLACAPLISLQANILLLYHSTGCWNSKNTNILHYQPDVVAAVHTQIVCVFCAVHCTTLSFLIALRVLSSKLTPPITQGPLLIALPTVARSPTIVKVIIITTFFVALDGVNSQLERKKWKYI